MPVEGEVLFRTREEVFSDLAAGLVEAIPDAYLGEEGTTRMLFEIISGVVESVFLAVQIVSEDMFVPTANIGALDRHGDEFGIPRKNGVQAIGTLKFTGAGGVIIPIGAEVAYDAGTGDDPLYFNTTAAGTIPAPGVPLAPTAALNAVAGNLTGLMEYAVTFVTAGGETALGAESGGVNTAAQQVSLTALPTGGAGTTARKIYRRKNGGAHALVTTINDNTTLVFNDNVTDGALGVPPPAASTAESISVAAIAEDGGTAYNVLPGAISVLSDVPDGITDVTNIAAFTGGTDEEATEDFRQRLLNAIRNPTTGSISDIQGWAQGVDGVEIATVYTNDNLGVATAGHVTVRISGPNSTVPSAAVQTAVLNELLAQGLAITTFHVTTFTQTVTAVGVTVTVAAGYVLADVTPAVQQAITNYINSLGVGETLRVAGIADAVFGLPGVLDVVVTTPASNQATGATSKRAPGVITVS